ncbi:MAG: glycerophosphodiester phosphodiesterase [Kibdelosporangium sp.]
MGSTKRTLPLLRPVVGRASREVLQIAHRGGSAGAENYEPGHLVRIAALGAHLVEIDVRATGDGHLVVHHDPTIVVDSRTVRIDATSMRDLTAIASGRVHPAASVIRAVQRAGLGAYVDIKDMPGSAVPRLIELLTMETMIDSVILASVDVATVARCAAAAPDVPRAVLFRSLDTDPVDLARAADADFLHPCWEHDARPDRLLAGPWLDNVRRHGLGVVCWHEERPDVLNALLALGVDGICTDDPALLAALAAGDQLPAPRDR